MLIFFVSSNAPGSPCEERGIAQLQGALHVYVDVPMPDNLEPQDCHHQMSVFGQDQAKYAALEESLLSITHSLNELNENHEHIVRRYASDFFGHLVSISPRQEQPSSTAVLYCRPTRLRAVMLGLIMGFRLVVPPELDIALSDNSGALRLEELIIDSNRKYALTYVELTPALA